MTDVNISISNTNNLRIKYYNKRENGRDLTQFYDKKNPTPTEMSKG